MFKRYEKRGVVWGTSMPCIIGLIVRGIFFMIFGIISGWGSEAIDFFKNLVRFGR